MCKVDLEMELRECKRESCMSKFRINKEHPQEFCSIICENRNTGTYYFVEPLSIPGQKENIFSHDGMIKVSEY